MTIILQAIKAVYGKAIKDIYAALQKLEKALESTDAQLTEIDTKVQGKADTVNPTFTGAFSMGRKAESRVGANSHAEGLNTTASADAAHAEGNLTVANSANSHAEGSKTTASGFAAHAEGQNTIAGSSGAHAEGCYTTAYGGDAHAEGYRTIANGTYSHAEGDKTKTEAIAYAAHAEGLGTIAGSEYQHVQGKYNVEDAERIFAHIVGGGTAEANRKNIHTVDWNGNAWYAGGVEGAAMIVASSTKNSTKRFKITVDDSGAITAAEIA